MTVTLNWGSGEKIYVGDVSFSNQKKVRKLNGVLSYGFIPVGVAGETDAFVMNENDRQLHTLPVERSGPDSFIELPGGRLVLLSLPYVLNEIVRGLGVSRSTRDDLWVIDFANGNAQLGSTYISERKHVLLGNLGSLLVDPK